MENSKDKFDAAYDLNPLIEKNPTDTMHKVSIVLGYLSEMRPLEGFAMSDDFYYGQDMVLTMCKSALNFHLNNQD